MRVNNRICKSCESDRIDLQIKGSENDGYICLDCGSRNTERI